MSANKLLDDRKLRRTKARRKIKKGERKETEAGLKMRKMIDGNSRYRCELISFFALFSLSESRSNQV